MQSQTVGQSRQPGDGGVPEFRADLLNTAGGGVDEFVLDDRPMKGRLSVPSSIGGLASGLDTAQIISAILQGERAGRVRIEQRQARHNQELTAWQDVDSKLGGLKTALGVFSSTNTLETGKATTNDEWLAAVTTGVGVQPGSFSFNIQQLAAAHQRMAKDFTTAGDLTGAGKAFVGTGVADKGLTLTDGSSLVAGKYEIDVRSKSGGNAVISFAGFEQTVADTGSITLSDGNGRTATFNAASLKVGKAQLAVAEADATTTIGQLATKLNALSAGITAAAIDVGSGANPVNFVVSATTTGVANALTIDFSALTGFGGHAFADLRAAANSRLLLADGVTTFERSTNQITDLLPGATIALKMAEPETTVTVAAERDLDGVVNATKAAIDALNSAVSSLKRNSSFDVASKKSQALAGDARVRRVADALRDGMHYVDSGQAQQRLSQLGITVKSDTTYAFNETTFRAALASDYSGTLRLLAGDTVAGTAGAFPALMKAVEDMRSEGGTVAGAIASAKGSVDAVAKDLTAEDVRLALVEQRVRKQYTRLEQTMANLSSQAAGLARALG
jgi:flagellar hook-associated protein 2